MSDKPSTLVLERAEWVFKEGDPGDSLFLIKSGMVQIVKEINGNEVTLRHYRIMKYLEKWLCFLISHVQQVLRHLLR